jgi:hypothetical protein
VVRRQLRLALPRWLQEITDLAFRQLYHHEPHQTEELHTPLPLQRLQQQQTELEEQDIRMTRPTLLGMLQAATVPTTGWNDNGAMEIHNRMA